MNEQKKFHELFREYIETKGMSVGRLAEMSAVPERFIEALTSGDYALLPAAPYVHGYLKRIGPCLFVDGEELWRSYKEERVGKSSGAEDTMPVNRFALKKIRRGWVVGALALAVLLSYAALRADEIIGAPSLVIENPPLGETAVFERFFVLRGAISPGDKLTLNGERVGVGEDGRFEKELWLDPGLNVFALTAARSLGGERTSVRRVIYQPASP